MNQRRRLGESAILNLKLGFQLHVGNRGGCGSYCDQSWRRRRPRITADGSVGFAGVGRSMPGKTESEPLLVQNCAKTVPF